QTCALRSAESEGDARRQQPRKRNRHSPHFRYQYASYQNGGRKQFSSRPALPAQYYRDTTSAPAGKVRGYPLVGGALHPAVCKKIPQGNQESQRTADQANSKIQLARKHPRTPTWY